MEVVNVNDATSFVTKDSAEIKEILAPTNSSLANQSLAEAKVMPGRCTQEHFHPKAEEIYYILRGKGKMTIEDETRDVRKGDGIAICPGQKHRISNTGDDQLVFLCCCSPAYSHEDTLLAD
ncbi:MAG: cupin domain-containing protein [Dehalococcoidia bacterium]|nr:cupin domain-containing protein [Dehalococcoidia bacterium]